MTGLLAPEKELKLYPHWTFQKIPSLGAQRAPKKPAHILTTERLIKNKIFNEIYFFTNHFYMTL